MMLHGRNSDHQNLWFFGTSRSADAVMRCESSETPQVTTIAPGIPPSSAALGNMTAIAPPIAAETMTVIRNARANLLLDIFFMIRF